MNKTQIPEVNKDDLIPLLQKETNAAREKNDTKNLILLLRKLGQTYIDHGDAPQALSEFDEALKIVSKGDDKEIFAQFLGLRGLALKMLGNYSLAMQAFRKSNHLAVEIKHPALSCDSFIQLAGLHSEIGKPEDAMACLNSAMQIALEQKDKPRKMRVCGLMGDHYLKQADPADSMEYFRQAYDLALDLGNRGAECSFIIKMGNVLLLEEKAEAAIDKYERALQLASALEDRNAEINILGGLFRAQAFMENIPLAMRYAEQVIHLAHESGLVDAEFTNIDALTSFLVDHGKAAEAIPYLERAVQISDDQNSLDMKLDMLTRLGLAFYQVGKNDQAIEYLNKAFVIAGNVSDGVTQMHVLSYLASVYADMDQFENSITVGRQALTLAEQFDHSRLAAEQQILLAFNHRDLHQTTVAVQHCLAARDLYRKVNDLAMVERVELLLNELQAAGS
jgi:tetratricopeptide (TPR) repeat protein